MKTQIMLDLETLGNKPGSVIVAIGAVKFGNGEILDSFYERVDAESCIAAGLKLDVSTVLWWLTQNEAARLEITKPGQLLTAVLIRFAAWVGDKDAEVWGNGAAFDNALLAAAYDATAMPRPWKFSNDRCYRTAKNLRLDVPLARSGTHHNALDDAESQARHLMLILSGGGGAEQVGDDAATKQSGACSANDPKFSDAPGAGVARKEDAR
jgi:exodeoxyribonuclease VIII